MRFHLLGLAHVPTSKNYSSCAYTQKIVKLSQMLLSLGHTVYLYGTEESDVECSELVIVSSKETRIKTYGNYDWKSQFFKHNPHDAAHLEFNFGAIQEINKRKEEKDFLLCPMGNYDKPISDAVGLMTVESGIGYEGVFCNKRVFESYAWMHYIYGILHQADGSSYDEVIPNYFDLKDFPYSKTEEKKDYFLYIGRLISRKGIEVAVEATKRLKIPLIIAGQGNIGNVDGLDFSKEIHVMHIGTVDAERRSYLMRHAIATFCPTYYIGPFEGVAVESQLCGTPVLTSDWGVFAETVKQGVTGFRCRTLGEFVWAAQHCEELKSDEIRNWAERYSMDVIKYQYQDYFEQLSDLWKEGWYEIFPDISLKEWRIRQGAK